MRDRGEKAGRWRRVRLGGTPLLHSVTVLGKGHRITKRDEVRERMFRANEEITANFKSSKADAHHGMR